MRERRAFLRRLLSRLIAEREDGALLYIPRGEEGMRRMIACLIAMRPAQDESDPLARDISAFLELTNAPADPKS